MFWRKCTVSYVATVLLGALAAAQTPAGPATSIRANTELVLVPAIVRDKSGAHIGSLETKDFVLLQDGEAQKIAVFEEIREKTQAQREAPSSPGEFSSQPAAGDRERHLTVIAIDFENTTWTDRLRVSGELDKFLEHAATVEEPIAIVAVTGRGLEIIHDFTTDPKVLKAALDLRKRGSHTPVSEHRPGVTTEAQDIMGGAGGLASNDHSELNLQHATDALGMIREQEIKAGEFRDHVSRLSSVDNLQQIAQALAGLPGRKSLVWVASGFPFANLIAASGLPSRYIGETAQASTASAAGTSSAIAAQEYTWRLLNQANIAVYPVDARGLTNTAFDAIDPQLKYSPDEGVNDAARNRNEDVIAAFAALAHATGGKPCYARTDLRDCFREAADDSNDYYILGYYVDRTRTRPGWHRLAVRVENQDARVRARNSFMLADRAPELARNYDLRLALNSPWLYTGLAFRGRWLPPTQNHGKMSVPFEVNIPSGVVNTGNDLQLDFDVAAIARNAKGEEAARSLRQVRMKLTPAQLDEIHTGGIWYRGSLDLPPGFYMTRIAVRDNRTGQLGAASRLLNVPRP